MEGAIDVRLIVTLGGILFSVAGAAAVGKMQIKAILTTLIDLEKRFRSLDKRLDTMETKVETQYQRLSIISSMMDTMVDTLTFRVKTKELDRWN